MSLDKALEANTTASLELSNAIIALIALLYHAEQDAPIIEAGQTPVAGYDAQSSAKKPEAAAKPSKATAAPTAAVPASTTPDPVAATSTSLSYNDIKTPFLELAKRDLAAAQALIAEFGFKTLKDAKPEQYAEILARLSGEERMA